MRNQEDIGPPPDSKVWETGQPRPEMAAGKGGGPQSIQERQRIEICFLGMEQQPLGDY